MMRRSFVTRHRVQITSFGVVLAAVAAVIGYALSVPGYSAHHAQINDGGIWVTRGKTGQFGRLNHPINQLDGVTYTPSASDSAGYSIDVLQQGSAVVGEDLSAGDLYPIDDSAVAVTSSAKVPLPGSPQVAMAGGTLAVLDPRTGALRALRFDPQHILANLAGVSSEVKPLATVGAGAALAVGQDGTVYAASRGGDLLTLRPRGDTFGRPGRSELHLPRGDVQLSVVGSRAVALVTGSASSRLIVAGGGSMKIDGAGAVLQQSGPSWGYALVATNSGLLAAPLNGGDVKNLATDGTGKPAAPVRFRGCTFAAWSGAPGAYGTQCGTDASTLAVKPIAQASTDLVFRTNWDQIMLNDRDSGDVWNIDTGTPQQVANWQTITRPQTQTTKQKNNHQDTRTTRPLPPKPQNDTLGARPGRTTPLYVLDNDNDPSGEVLAVDSVDAAPAVKRMLSISPDGQTVDLRMPAGFTQSVSFKYTVRAPRGGTASADVVVNNRTPSENAPPQLRYRYVGHTWSVPAGGAVTIPALADWRDYTDGDPVVLTKATASAGTVSTTPDGQLIYSAPASSGTQSIDYDVSDGFANGTTHAQIKVNIEGDDGKPVPAVAEPDYVRGQVGKPITVQPLANDLPGSDPLNPTATLALAGDVASLPTAQVTTDQATGDVVVVPKQVGVVELHYQVKYGDAAYAQGLIVVQSDPRTARPQPPVTAPDVAVLHGQHPVTVDVLANDSDPAGNVMVVQQATPADADQVQVAVLDGQFLRITALQPQLSPTVQNIDYTVSDGVSGQSTGSVTVTQVPSTDSDQPVALDDYATVRSGQSVAVPVLDNDSTPDGDAVNLVRSAAGTPGPGQFTVEEKVGAAYASGRYVRYVAPVVRATTSATVDYLEQTDAGAAATGKLHLTIVPPPSRANPNRQPAPQPVIARAIAGQTIQIKIPTSGVDPDGDPVTVTGIGSASSLGRVLAITGTGIRYQAYPNIGNGGTDTFSYQVTDCYGATATATVRVAVVPPGDPQPPVAVDDSIVAAPDTTVRVDALANDIVAPDDQVHIEALDRRNPLVADGQVKLAGARGPIVVRSPHDAAHPVSVVYRLTDGISSTTATISVKAQDGIDLPPVAFDQYARAQPGARVAQVNLLAGDYDPDSDSPLTVVSPADSVGGKATVTLQRFPQVLPYVVRDAHGGTASAVVYVPSVGAGAPVVRPGATITVPKGKSVKIDIRQYVVDPANRTVRTTTTDTISASPSVGLAAKSAGDAEHLLLTPTKSYSGPAAITFQVTDGKTLSDPTGNEAFLTIPVQVGPVTPVLRCPSAPLSLAEGGQATQLAVAAVCHVWMPNPADADQLKFSASWQRAPKGVALSGSGSPVLSVRATASAAPGASGALTVDAISKVRATPSTLDVQVVRAPKMQITPITIDGVKAGTARTIDISQYLESQLAGPKFLVVGRPVRTSGMPASISARGSTVTVQPGGGSKGTITFTYVATDVPGHADRYVTGQITLHVLGKPEAPTQLTTGTAMLSHAVDLHWTSPAANGAPIDFYLVDYGSGTRRCAASPCALTGLNNGRTYRIEVRAHNSVGLSAPSNSVSAMPDAVPGPVTGWRTSQPRDRTLTVSWARVVPDGTPVAKYELSWTGGGHTETSATSAHVATASNSITSFQIFAVNQKSQRGPVRTYPGQSAWTPGQLAMNAVPAEQTTDTSASTVADVTWNAENEPNGPPVKLYTIYRSTGTAAGSAETGQKYATVGANTNQFYDRNISNDGRVYTYSVTATNGAGYESARSAPRTFTALSRPGPVSINTVSDHDASGGGFDGAIQVKFTLGAANGDEITRVNYDLDGDSGSWPINAKSGSFAKMITGLTNGNTYKHLTLNEHNRDAAGNENSEASVDSSTDGSWSPYAKLQNLKVSANGTGSKVTYTVSVDPNGRSAQVTVSDSAGKYSKTFSTDAGAAEWQTSDTFTLGFGNNDTVNATAKNATVSPALTASSGTISTDSPSVTVNPGPLGKPSYCTSNSCYQIDVQGSGFDPGDSYDVLYGTTCATCAGVGPSCPDYSTSASSYYYACEVIQADGSGNLSVSDRYFGYPGKTVFVDVGNPRIAGGRRDNWP